MKQSSLDEQEQLGMELESQNAENEDDIPDYYRQYDDPMNGDKNNGMMNEAEFNKQPSISTSLPAQHPTLPWAPKVRSKDIYQFMDISRKKFIGYSLTDNIETTAGLPKPICEGINILKRVSWKLIEIFQKNTLKIQKFNAFFEILLLLEINKKIKINSYSISTQVSLMFK